MSEKTLLIIGAGGHGKAVAEAALLSGEWQRIAFADDRWPGLRETFGWQVVCDVAGLPALEIQCEGAIAAIGNNALREQCVKAIRDAAQACHCCASARLREPCSNNWLGHSNHGVGDGRC